MPNHAIVIGINDYPGMQDLKGPCNDAQGFLEWVTRPGPGDVEPANVHKLFSTDFDPEADFRNAKPLSDQIVNTFEEILAGNPVQHDIGDRLYVFVAGHGMSDINRPESAAVIAANASKSSIAIPHVVVTDYVHYFRRIYAFKEIVLIMDCCLDALVQRPLDRKGLLQGTLHERASQVKMFLAKATVWGKQSYEKDFNGATRGIFSVAFMDALEKAPADGTNVTGKAVKDYIDLHIKKIAGDKTIEDPTINGQGHEKIVFYERSAVPLHGVAPGFTLTVRVNGAVGGEMVDLYDGSLALVETKPVADGLVTFPVRTGMYKISLQGTDRQALIEIGKDHEETL